MFCHQSGGGDVWGEGKLIWLNRRLEQVHVLRMWKTTKLEVKIDSVDFIRADLSPALVWVRFTHLNWLLLCLGGHLREFFNMVYINCWSLQYIPPIKVAVRDVTFLVRTLKARNSSNSSSAESCFFTEQSLCFPSRSTERRIWFCSTGESTYHVHGFFLLCLPVRETETIMSGRESSWDTRKAFQMSLSQKARLYCLIHKLYCKIRGFKIM